MNGNELNNSNFVSSDQSYFSKKEIRKYPRLPLEGNIDLTYRCNNRCLHCWSWETNNIDNSSQELSFDEIKDIVLEANSLGCKTWNISGGEPMVHPEFIRIFDFITSNSLNGYGLNTNGTLITPDIAELMRRKGLKMIALYGATEEIYDKVTRHPGGFQKLLKGISLLQKAEVNFVMQLIPMKANWHQWDEMIKLAQELSPQWRLGAAWLYKSKSTNPLINLEIEKQRLPPEIVVQLDKPNPSFDELRLVENQESSNSCNNCLADNRLFASCISRRNAFHIDPYGKMSWCAYIDDEELRYDLRKGNFKEGWDEFIPSCKDKVLGGAEFANNCGSCSLNTDCRWCAVFAKFETGRYSAPINYLCKIAEETHNYKIEWKKQHRKYYQVAGITICLESDLELSKFSFPKELETFKVDSKGDDVVHIRHYFNLPDVSNKNLGIEIYRKAPWAVYKKNNSWIYLGISDIESDPEIHRVSVFNKEYTSATLFNRSHDIERVLKYGFGSLTLFPTDQILLCQLLSNRNAALIHSSAAIINGKGFLFVGHSDAGKSTTMELLKSAKEKNNLDIEILCDDRNIVRRWESGWKLYGTWSHGTTRDVSAQIAPLSKIFFINQSPSNQIVPIFDKNIMWKKFLATLIRGVVTESWWKKELEVLTNLINEIPCYNMHFDKSGDIVHHLLDQTKN